MIPKIVHQIDDGRPVNAVTLARFYDYEVIYWSVDDLTKLAMASLTPKYYDLFCLYRPTTQMPHFGRWLVLHAYGGIFLDQSIDVRPPDQFLKYHGFCRASRGCTITPHFDYVGLEPGHPLCNHIFRVMAERVTSDSLGFGYATGEKLFQEIMSQWDRPSDRESISGAPDRNIRYVTSLDGIVSGPIYCSPVILILVLVCIVLIV